MNPHPLRVLIVEDEALLAMDLEETVEECGHVIAGEARCLHSAEALSDQTAPDLAFVDVHLARGTSGVDVCSMIRRRWPSAVVIFVTANPTRIPGDLAGAHGVITKPFSHRGLTSTLRYLAEGILDPPPNVAKPSTITLSEDAARRWTH